MVDALSEVSRRWSPFVYGYDNPVRFVDPVGMWNVDAQGNSSTSDPDEIENFIKGQKGINEQQEAGRNSKKMDGNANKPKRPGSDLPTKADLQEKGLEAKKGGFLSFMRYAFSAEGLTHFIDIAYDLEGTGALDDDAHPISKVNEIATIYAVSKLFITVGKGANAIRKEIKIPDGFKRTGK
jgi:hypothetical protein